MGSSSYGPSYGGGAGGGSQPYAPMYHVVPSMMEKDKEDINIYDPKKGYFTNPLATSIQSAIKNGRIYMTGLKAHGTYTYVVDAKGNLIFAKRYNPNNSKSRAPHPTLIGGRDPVVRCAGMVYIERGRIVWYNNDSGHFRPDAKSLEVVELALTRLKITNPEVFSNKYEGGKRR